MGFLLDRFFIKQPKFRRWATRLLEGDKDLDIDLLGATLRVNTVKEHGYLRASRLSHSSALFRDELAVILNLAALLADGDTFVDCGANVGIFSLNLARMQRLLPGTRFYAFEANPDTFQRLATQTAKLPIEAHNVALSDHAGTLEFVQGAVSHVFTTVEHANFYSIPKERCSVPCRRLDEFGLVGDSLILKIDVEGQEKAVLDGAAALFRKGRVKAVYLDGYKDESIEAQLRGYGLRLLNGRTLEPAIAGEMNLLALR